MFDLIFGPNPNPFDISTEHVEKIFFFTDRYKEENMLLVFPREKNIIHSIRFFVEPHTMVKKGTEVLRFIRTGADDTYGYRVSRDLYILECNTEYVFGEALGSIFTWTIPSKASFFIGQKAKRDAEEAERRIRQQVIAEAKSEEERLRELAEAEARRKRQAIEEAEAEERKRQEELEAEERAFWNSPEGRRLRAERELAEIRRQERLEVQELARRTAEEEHRRQQEAITALKDL